MEIKDLHQVNIDILHRNQPLFSAGNLKNHLKHWKALTRDKFIINIITHGLRIHLDREMEGAGPHEYNRNDTENDIIAREIGMLSKKEAICISKPEIGDHFSNIFVRPKKSGKFRTILNLKKLNTFCDKIHFKMESIRSVTNMVKKGVYMASVDLQDAFYSVPVHPDSKKYLKFVWKSTTYVFNCMPNGYRDAMRVFTKILKPVFASLRERGHMSIIYVDDSFLQGDTQQECYDNIISTITLLQQLGFTVSFEKSILNPSKVIIFLGFSIDSDNMTICLTREKKARIIEIARSILKQNRIAIRAVAKLLGHMAAAFIAVPYGLLHYRSIEKSKIRALRVSKGDFDSCMTLSRRAQLEINWWIDNVMQASQSLYELPVDTTIFSDASKIGWGATEGVEVINGRWLTHEKQEHINYLEMLAAKNAVRSFISLEMSHIRLMMDNTTAICYVNKMGGTKSPGCNRVAREIWQTCIEHNVWLSAAHIPGKENVVADTASRVFEDAHEWMISDIVFEELCRRWGRPHIDAFATKNNKKLNKFMSWKPDPEAMVIDAFSTYWKGIYIYSFPPFSCIWRVLRKIALECDQAILVTPLWTTQSWWPGILRHIVEKPIVFSSRHLQLPGTVEKHPMCPKLNMVAVKLSRDLCKHMTFLRKQGMSSNNLGERAQGRNTIALYRDGRSSVVRGTTVHFDHL